MAKSQNKDSFSGIYKAIVIFSFILALCTAINQIYMSKQAKSMMQQAGDTPSITSVTYVCDGNATIQAQFFDDKAELEMPDDSSLLLTQGISASGVRYTNSDESLTFWTKGNTAFMQEGENITYNNCVETTN